jgi:nitrile hydratase accessory protein
VSATLPPLPGELAPPRSNGEPVFEQPWESRAFGMVLALHAQGAFAWDEFRDLLIEEIQHGEREGGRPYSESWVAAFGRLALRKGLLSEADLAARQEEFLSGARQDVF